MKKIVLPLLLIFFATTIKAQDSTSYRKNLNMLIKDAQNEFAINQGELLSKDAAQNKEYYKTTVDLKCNQSIVQKNTDDNSKVSIYYFKLTEVEDMMNSSSFLSAALALLNDMHSSGNYRGKDFTNTDESTTTEIKDLAGNYIAELTSSSKDKYIKFMVYSKKWGKR